MELAAGLLQGAFLAAAAGCAGLCLAQGREFRGAAMVAGVLALAALAALYLLRAQSMLDEDLRAVVARDGLEILATRAGQALAVAAALLAGALGLLALDLRLGLAAALAFMAALAPLAAAHAFAAAPLDRTGASVFAAHAVLALAWFGGLTGLLARRRRAGFSAAIARFSRFALPAMVGLLMSGSWLAWSEGGGRALLVTPYGWTLGVKLAALAGALVCAARLRTMLKPGATPAAATLALEVALAVGVLLAAGALGQLEPGAHGAAGGPP